MASDPLLTLPPADFPPWSCPEDTDRAVQSALQVSNCQPPTVVISDHRPPTDLPNPIHPEPVTTESSIACQAPPLEATAVTVGGVQRGGSGVLQLLAAAAGRVRGAVEALRAMPNAGAMVRHSSAVRAAPWRYNGTSATPLLLLTSISSSFHTFPLTN